METNDQMIWNQIRLEIPKAISETYKFPIDWKLAAENKVDLFKGLLDMNVGSQMRGCMR